MPIKVVPKVQAPNGNNSVSGKQSRGSNPSRAEEQSPGDGRTRRKLRKEPPNSPKSPVDIQQTPPLENDEQRPRISVKRRPSLRNNKVPMGARPLGSVASKQPSYNNPTNSNRTISGNRSIPRSRQSSISNASQFNFGTKSLEAANSKETETEVYPFLPPVNFDDLQSSLQLCDFGDFSHEKGSKSPTKPAFQIQSAGDVCEVKQNGKDVRKVLEEPVGARPTRTSSLIRQPSNSSSLRGQVGPKADTMAPPARAAAQPPKTRRQSHFPTSTPGTSIGRAPRKSIGPGVLANSTSEYSIFTNGLAAKADRQRQEYGRQPRSRETSGAHAASRHSMAAAGDLTRPQSSRGMKAKSMQPPAKFSADFLHAASSTPENPWSTPISAQRSPGRESYGHGTPGSNKRMSQMPGHASGLGARTISPTDARRMKRLSLMPNPPPLPQTPPTTVPEPLPLRARSTVDSPFFIPRKSVTPSSNRTTPDHNNRKSYSSVVSVSSSTSFSSTKASNNQTRLQQTASVSRLPTSKSRSESAANAASEEGVPPVPAIPKAYESPKGEPESPFFAPRKSSLQPSDALSVNSSSTLEYASAASNNSSDKETPKPEREQKQTRGTNTRPGDNSEERASGAQDGRRTLQPLRLPPLNLLPINTETADKVNSLAGTHQPSITTPITPPPQRGPPKTPSTPMTASKATFFTRHRGKDETVPVPIQARSNSSHHALRSDTFPIPASLLSTGRMPVDLPLPRKTTSPFTSSSLPKNSAEFPPLRSKPSVASVDASSVGTETRTSRLTGPRALTSTKTPKGDTVTQQRSPSEADSSSFGNSIRRKLSLTRRRSSSKIEGDQPPKPPSHESMPPPKLPASATISGPWVVESGPAHKTSYLHSRRKSSHPETHARQERARSEVFSKESVSAQDPKSALESKHLASTKLSQSSLRRPSSNASFASNRLQIVDTTFDGDDLVAEEEMRQLAKKRKKTDQEARELDELRRRAVPRDRVSPAQALKAARLNIYERGEIVDYKDVYFCGTSDAKKFAGNLEAENVNFGYDDERGDYNIVVGDHLAYRFEVVDILGKGSFGQVVRCVDHKTGGLEAIKIIRNKKRFHQQALVEVNILQKIRDWDPDNKYSMVNFTQSFYFRGHLCISTELLGMNLYEFIKVHDFRGFSLKLIRRFTKQMLNCLVLLKSKKVIHCDLKPENILLAHPAHSEIKVIDFGSSCLENEKVYTYIQSRFYRSPEVILGMTYGMPIDMWSLGCILAELLTGYPIFPGENEQEQLACIMEVFGPPDKHLIEKSTRKKLFFDSLGKPRLTVSSKGKRRRPSSKTLQQAIKCDDDAFLDFLARCLRWDPERRMRPDEAIHHEFITGIKPVASRNLRTLPPSSTNATSSSPIKRFNSMHTPSSAIRPLPEPPTTVLKAATAGMGRGISNGSPNKAAPKRHSTVTATSNTVASARKGPGPAPMTALPKLAGQRNTSGRTDLASAAAAAATTKSR